MQIRLSDHFTYSRLLRFTLPSVVTMIVASIYSVVDGLFVSNLVGAMALSAINIAFPVAMIIGAVGFMLGTGGSALVAKTLGEGKKELANQYFSMLIYSIIGIGAILTVIILIFVRPIMRLAGASDLLMESSVTYGTILISGSVPFMLQVSFQNFFVVNEKPVLGLVLSIASGGIHITVSASLLYKLIGNQIVASEAIPVSIHLAAAVSKQCSIGICIIGLILVAKHLILNQLAISGSWS